MQISKREKNILILAALVALVFIMSWVLPAIGGVYQARSNTIEDMRLEIERERRLFDETINWRNRRTEVESIQDDLESQIFEGATIPVIEASIQRVLTQHARDNNITINSTRLAERLETDGWIMVQQEMSFRTTNAANTVSFLQNLDQSKPRLFVTDFSIDRSRNQYGGSITAVGFARSDGLLTASSGTR